MEIQSKNRNIEAAWSYHNSTKHSWHSVHTASHYLEFDNQPTPFKIYRQLEGIRLPTDLPSSDVSALKSLTGPGVGPGIELTLRHLAGLLYYTAGITKRGIVPGGQIFFRAAACTGALYHIELYLVCGGLPGLEDGVYHFSPHDFSLRQLRSGDFRQVLVEASGGEPAVAGAPAILVTSSVYWRNAWKYQSRAYRHSWWDSGTMLANLLAMGRAHDISLQVVTSFMDRPVNELLGLNTDKEAALHLVPVGSAGAPSEAPAMPPLDLEVARYSPREVDYPQIAEVHSSAYLATPEEVSQLRGNPPTLLNDEAAQDLVPLQSLPEEEEPDEFIEPVIVRRGSSRRFRREPISLAQLSTILRVGFQDIPADFLGIPGGGLTQGYLIANSVNGLESGSYAFDTKNRTLERLKSGDLRQESGYLGLQQELPADASVNVYFMTDLAAVLERFGNRGIPDGAN